MMKLHFTTSDFTEAAARCEALVARYGQHDAADCDAIVVLGGDGKMLEVLKTTFETGKPVFGLNCGTVGFLMNEYSEDNLPARVANAGATTINPLEMQAIDTDGRKETAHAINEVSLWRETGQTARIRISTDGEERLDELTADGVLISTPAGSTAYNFSAHGPIMPLNSNLLALTPISAFRPRRWRGAIIPNSAVTVFDILDSGKRPVSASADGGHGKRYERVKQVSVKQDNTIGLVILSDPGHGLEEKAMREQFET